MRRSRQCKKKKYKKCSLRSKGPPGSVMLEPRPMLKMMRTSKERPVLNGIKRARPHPSNPAPCEGNILDEFLRPKQQKKAHANIIQEGNQVPAPGS